MDCERRLHDVLEFFRIAVVRRPDPVQHRPGNAASADRNSVGRWAPRPAASLSSSFPSSRWPRQATTEFTVRNGHFVKGTRSVGLTSILVNPWSRHFDVVVGRAADDRRVFAGDAEVERRFSDRVFAAQHSDVRQRSGRRKRRLAAEVVVPVGGDADRVRLPRAAEIPAKPAASVRGLIEILVVSLLGHDAGVVVGIRAGLKVCGQPLRHVANDGVALSPRNV